MDESQRNRVAERLTELNQKATQLLTFLSFAIIAAIVLETNQIHFLTSCEGHAARWSLRFRVSGLFPILLTVLPIQEFIDAIVARNCKIVLLWIALLLMIPGAIAFLCAVW